MKHLKSYENFVEGEEEIKKEWLPKELYHISPSINEEKILKNGIKTSNGGGTWFNRTYTPRVYLATSLIAAYDLQVNFISHDMAKKYTIFKIETSLISEGRFFEDSKFAHGIYIEQNIPKEAIIEVIDPDILSYDAEDLENLYNTTWMD